MADRATHCGKQVMLDGKHYADAVTVEAAFAICVAVNHFIAEGAEYFASAGLPGKRTRK